MKDPKAPEEDPSWGWLLGATIGLEGVRPLDGYCILIDYTMSGVGIEIPDSLGLVEVLWHVILGWWFPTYCLMETRF